MIKEINSLTIKLIVQNIKVEKTIKQLAEIQRLKLIAEQKLWEEIAVADEIAKELNIELVCNDANNIANRVIDEKIIL